ncbi:Trypsin, partial [Oryctes borbonicus]
LAMRIPIVIFIVYANIYAFYLEEGEFCEEQNGVKGICRLYFNCSTAIKEVAANKRPKICSFEGLVPIVCCVEGNYSQRDKDSVLAALVNAWNLPTILPFDENNLSLRKCREFHTVKEDYPPFGFVGGINSLAKEFPHMALLGYGDPNDIQWECGGSLISEEFVLTAAHCLYSRLGGLKFIRLGELDLASTTDDADPQDFSVKQTYPHPNYTGISRYHDIALVRLHQPARLTDYVKPACLAITNNFTNTPAPQGMGWGLTSSGGNPANILQHGYLRFIPVEDCQKIYGTSRDLKEGILDKIQICADGGDVVRDTCPGDSGGPLLMSNSRYRFTIFPEIVGVTAFGKDCGAVAGVYTRVLPYIPWIEKIVWPNS